MSPSAATAARASSAHSTVTSTGAPAPRRTPSPSPPPPSRTPLRVVPPRRTPARAPFVLLVSVVLGGGLVLVLLVNTWLAQGSFTVKRLQQQQAATRIQVQSLAQQIAAVSAPDALAAKASQLAMVPAPNPVFKTATGEVLGVAQRAWLPAPPPPAPTLATTPVTTMPAGDHG